VILRWLPAWWPYVAVAAWPGVILARRGASLSARVVNHERIHHAQQREMLILPFFVWYVLEFMMRFLFTFSWGKAYRNLLHEREAKRHEGNAGYLARRSAWAWIFGK
jgi:hypothetical protein